MAEDARKEIRQWLAQSGYSAEDLAAVMKRVEQYDYQSIHDAWFDSIGGGEFSIHKIIREALGHDHQG